MLTLYPSSGFVLSCPCDLGRGSTISKYRSSSFSICLIFIGVSTSFAIITCGYGWKCSTRHFCSGGEGQPVCGDVQWKGGSTGDLSVTPSYLFIWDKGGYSGVWRVDKSRRVPPWTPHDQEVFEYEDIPEDIRIKMTVLRVYKYASLWCENLNHHSRHERKEKIRS